MTDGFNTHAQKAHGPSLVRHTKAKMVSELCDTQRVEYELFCHVLTIFASFMLLLHSQPPKQQQKGGAKGGKQPAKKAKPAGSGGKAKKKVRTESR